MADKDLKPRGTVDPSKKPSWLKEVKVDAARNTIEHLRRQKESQEFELAKARGVTVEEIVSKGREDLDMAPQEDEDEDGFDEASSAEEVAELKKELQKERAARTRAENKLKKAEEESEPAKENDPAEEDQPEKSVAGVPAVLKEEEKN